MRLLLALILVLNVLPASANTPTYEELQGMQQKCKLISGIKHPKKRWQCDWNVSKLETVKQQEEQVAYNKAHPQPQVIYSGYQRDPALGLILFNQLQHNAYNQFQTQYPSALPQDNPYSNYR